MNKLTDKQKRFVKEYLVDLNATQAAIRAGYSKETARQMGSENLAKPVIADKIAKANEKKLKEAEIDAQWVLNQAVKLHKRCMQEIKPKMHRVEGELVPLVDDQGNYVFEFNAAGASKALELTGKHVNIQAFKEKVEHSVDEELTQWLQKK